MKNIIEALLIVWPRGIPTSEYERALTLAGKFGALAPSLRTPTVEPKSTPAAPTKKSPPVAKRIGEPGLRKIRAALSTGPCTAAEVRMVTGLSNASVWNGLQIVGKVVEKRQVSPYGSPTFVYTLKEGA
jgi:hypothetical protein